MNVQTLVKFNSPTKFSSMVILFSVFDFLSKKRKNSFPMKLKSRKMENQKIIYLKMIQNLIKNLKLLGILSRALMKKYLKKMILTYQNKGNYLNNTNENIEIRTIYCSKELIFYFKKLKKINNFIIFIPNNLNLN